MSTPQFLKSDAWASHRPGVPALIGLVTFGILALELALIRWTSSQVRIFAYFNNTVLICAFLGIGLGAALGRKLPGLVHLTMPVLLAASLPIALSEPLQLVYLPFPDQSIVLWGGQIVPANAWTFVKTLGIFFTFLVLIIATFVCAGAALGALFGRLRTLRAYQADLIGSLVGVLAFTAAAWLNAGAAWWLAMACVPLTLVSRRVSSAIAAAAVIGLAAYSANDALFSPYNRIDLLRSNEGGYELRVNRDFHQYMFDLSDQSLGEAKSSEVERMARKAVRGLYDLPFTINAKRGSALIVGAGTGNDVQAALRNGYAEVTSVDIDGRIIQLGRELHPERPYANPRAKPVVDDARAFFEKNREQKFDVVCFGLLDSHAMSSAMSTLRLDNFVYTEEGIRAAWNRVGEGGHLSLALSCNAGRWFYERLHWTIARATGREPRDYYSPLHGGTATFVVFRDGAKRLPDDAPNRTVIHPVGAAETTLTTSDDWPFLYLRPGVVPWGYLVVLGLILTLAFTSIRKAFGAANGESERFHWPLFFMGAAFLLIETRGVTTLSLLFGSTWVVNSVVFAGILVMVLVGNTAVRCADWKNPRPWFAALFAAVLLLYAFPIGWLHTLPLLARGIVGGLLTGLPVGIAGIIVPMLLARATDPARALGANLLGSVLGGCLEYLSMYTGLKAMALMAAVLYLAAYLALNRREARMARLGVELPQGETETVR